MPMTLEQWDWAVGYHLSEIASHAEHIVSHVEAMTHRPEWKSQANYELHKAELALASALSEVRYTIEQYREKPADA